MPEDPQFNLRTPRPLRDLIDEAATRNRRSATAEVLWRLEESFRREGIDPATGKPIGGEGVEHAMRDLAGKLEVVRGLIEEKSDGGS